MPGNHPPALKNKSRLLLALGLLAAWSPGTQAAESTSQPPNVIIFLADDLAYSDLSTYGNRQIKTPRIDQLAAGGAKFLNGYVSGCTCSPTRAGLMTGRYQQRFGFEANAEGGKTGEEIAVRSLDRAAVLFPQRMKALGYVTGMIGKWHLGDAPWCFPTERGYDEFFGILPYGIERGDGRELGNPPATLYRGKDHVPTPENFMNAFGDEALAFLERHQKKPFFLYVPFTAIHAKQVGAEPWLSRTDASLPLPRRKRLADILQLDEITGRILDKIRELGLEENTLIFFLSDNGAGAAEDSKPFRGTKWTLWEGGIHEPFIVSWKGKIPAGQIVEHPVIQLDILPTTLAAAGGKIDPEWKLDGVNLLPLLEKKTETAPHDALFWRVGPQFAVRQGDWKLVKAGLAEPVRLFNLAEDKGEAQDLAAKEPARVQELQVKWDEWNRGNQPPRWEDKRWNGKEPTGH